MNTFTGARNLAGYIGLQNHDAGSHVHFRYVRIKELDLAADTTATLDPGAPDGDARLVRVAGHRHARRRRRRRRPAWRRPRSRSTTGRSPTYDGPVTVGDDGEHVVAYRSTDSAGNVEESKTVAFKIDGTAPDDDVQREPDAAVAAEPQARPRGRHGRASRTRPRAPAGSCWRR